MQPAERMKRIMEISAEIDAIMFDLSQPSPEQLEARRDHLEALRAELASIQAELAGQGPKS